MRPLTAAELLTLWETGIDQQPLQRALTLLAAAEPDLSREALVSLSIGQRDARLFRLREMLFGSLLKCLAECPHCGQLAEFSLRTGDLLLDDANAGSGELMELTLDDLQLCLRPLNSQDLLTAAACPTVELARQALLERCVLAASPQPMPVDVAAFSAEIQAELSARLAEYDRQADIVLVLNCAACARTWQSVLDIAAYLWTEVNNLAKRLLQEVHTLAWAYGWREADILAMSEARRRLYLDMVG